MKITITASVEQVETILAVKELLEREGHEVYIPASTQKMINGELDQEKFSRMKELQGDSFYRQQLDASPIKKHWELIRHSDAIYVINVTKKGIENYIGGGMLLEMGFAFEHDKKIFLHHPIPERSQVVHYVDEIKEMNPIVINGDLTLIQ